MRGLGRNSRLLLSLGALLLLGIGFVSGVWLQRTYGTGDLLRAAGVLPPRTEIVIRPTRTAVGLPAEFQGQLALFVLAGQSNMSGWAPLPAEQTLHPRAYLFGNDYLWRLAQEPTDHPEGQVDRVSLDLGRELPGTSPGLSFATTLLDERPEMVVGLIPCAKGASTIYEWQRRLDDNTLYGSCLKRIAAASTMGKVAGILFFQGEADALDPESDDRLLSAHNYGERFSQFISDLRHDLGRPTLPIIFAQIGSHEAPEAFINWTVVQEQQASVELPCVTMITTNDLPLHDGVHYTTESYQIIGERFAAAYVQLMQTQECE